MKHATSSRKPSSAKSAKATAKASERTDVRTNTKKAPKRENSPAATAHENDMALIAEIMKTDAVLAAKLRDLAEGRVKTVDLSDEDMAKCKEARKALKLARATEDGYSSQPGAAADAAASERQAEARATYYEDVRGVESDKVETPAITTDTVLQKVSELGKVYGEKPAVTAMQLAIRDLGRRFGVDGAIGPITLKVVGRITADQKEAEKFLAAIEARAQALTPAATTETTTTTVN